jgi:hypothetical protein
MTGLGAVSIGFTLLLARRWHGEAIIHGGKSEHLDTI